MAWCQPGDTPLSEPVLTQLTDAYTVYGIRGDELIKDRYIWIQLKILDMLIKMGLKKTCSSGMTVHSYICKTCYILLLCICFVQSNNLNEKKKLVKH